MLVSPRFGRSLRRARRRFDARPLDGLLALVATGVTAYALVAPLTAVHYPPMTDLPMHAAVTSALRHWFDPAWHFQDQFELQPLRAPVLTIYALGAALALILPIAVAVKAATAVALATLPAGLAVLCKGLKKPPAMGIAAAGLAWGTFTDWGFVNFIGAVGLTLMGVGITFMVAERPTRGRLVGLAIVSLLVFFTHVSRMPTYLVCVAFALAVMRPGVRALRMAAAAVAPSVLLLLPWWVVRPITQQGSVSFHFDASRGAKIADWLLHGFRGPEERSILGTLACIVMGIAVYSVAVRIVGAARGKGQPPPSRRAVRATVAVALMVALFLGLYFTLPLEVGAWSLVYPREILPAALLATAALPRLPRDAFLRAPAVALLLLGVMLPERFISAKYAAFDRMTQDFRAVVAELPLAPKLGYILFDRSGSDGETLPMLHLPAWIQAERGGWLSFHFATWQATPIVYRTSPGADVPPATPDGFEMHPDMFDVATRGKYFDWILVRSPSSPAQRMAVDPALRLVRHLGTWWLYARR